MTTPPPPGPPEGGTQAPEQAPPTCYRHPDRETYVRCTRCNRPICPDCMRPAAVGFHCPECVAEGRSSQRVARTAIGGRPAGSAVPVVTFTLLALNVLLYVGQQLDSSLTARLALVPAYVADGEYYRLITATFLHASILHIGFNMYALFLVGPQLEQLFGRWRFGLLYLLAAAGGSAASYAFNPPYTAGIGASGAVFGLFGAFYVVARRLRADTSFITTLLVINLVLGFVIQGVDWHAHLGGLATGALFAGALAYAPSRLRALAPVGAGLALAVVIAVGVALRTAAITPSPFG